MDKKYLEIHVREHITHREVDEGRVRESTKSMWQMHNLHGWL